MGKSKDKQAKKDALLKKLSAPALLQIDEMMEQLSQRHETSIRKISKLEQELDAKLEQLSDRHAAVVAKMGEQEKEIDEKLEQLSDRHAAALGRIAELESSHVD